MSRGQRINSVLKRYAASEADLIKKGVFVNAAEYVEELEQMEQQYCQRLGRLAQLCDETCQWIIDSPPELVPNNVAKAAAEIMEYVHAVRP